MHVWPVIQGGALIAIAIIGAAIANGQWQATKAKLQLDLFDRRYTVFAGLKGLLAHMTRHGDVTLEAITEFDIATVEADFLFGQPVVDYLAFVRDKAFDLHRAREIVRDHAHPERRRAIEQSKDLMIWLGGQYEAARDVFRPYLRLDTNILNPDHRWWPMKRRSAAPAANG